MKTAHRLLILAALGLAPAAFAEVSEYQLGFGPYVGGGDISTGAKVRSTSGYALSIERNWALSDKIALGPRFEFANAFVNTRQADGDTKTIATYDNRIIAAGFRLSRNVGNDHTFAQGVYLTGVAGKGYSKLSLDESTERSYRQSLRGNISGNYFGGELGSWVPLKGSFGINVAALGSIYEADQSKSPGTYEGDEVGPEGNLQLTKGEYEQDDGTLDERVVMKTFALKVGLSLGF